MRLLGLDYGSKTVGVAVSDPLFITAQGVEIITREQENKLRRTLARIKELCEQYEVTEIVLGLPLNMNGTEGPRCVATREFADQVIKRTGLPVHFQDERLTTVAADRAMDEAGYDYAKKKQHVDELAAVLILQNYMDRVKNNG